MGFARHGGPHYRLWWTLAEVWARDWWAPMDQCSLPTQGHPVQIDGYFAGCSNTVENGSASGGIPGDGTVAEWPRAKDGRETKFLQRGCFIFPEDVSVAKILVADDNSNIQKMVGLALKDQGIDVVAVGNGEAAVRKISDIHPDLVLADVFMPVRNGYEVCQYVKQDAALAHIPVILLVGAFDPLDEQEAQRVGADGVLKKPFVPPDPLIAMVKAALTRAGVAYSTEKAIGADKPGKNGERKAAEFLAAKPAPVPTPVVIAPPVTAPESISMEDLDGLVEEVSLPPTPVKMDGEAPLAFGNLMESGSAVEGDAGLVARAHPELVGERDWRSAEEDADVPEEDEEEKQRVSWRRDADIEEESEGATGAVRDWRDTALNEPPARKSAREDWKGVEQAPAMTEAAATRESAAAIFPEAPVAVRTVPPASAAKPEELPQVAAFSADAWANAISAGESEVASLGAPEQTSAKNGAHTLTAENIPSGENETPAAATLAVEHDAVATAIDRFAGSQDARGEIDNAAPTSTGAWEMQAMKASLLAATWDKPVAEATMAEVAAKEAANNTAMSDVAAHAPAIGEAPTAQEAARTVFADDRMAAPFTAPVERADTFAEAQEVAHEQHAAEAEAAVEEGSSWRSEAEAPVEMAALVPEVETPKASISESPLEAIQTDGAPEAKAPRAEAIERCEEVAAAPEEVAWATEGAVQSFYAAGPPSGEDAAEKVLEAAAPAEIEAPTESKPATEDVVAKVLASLSPEVMQAVTRELLKPVVEAMVREELNKKK
jgi:CheY-like chemotaxis protein